MRQFLETVQSRQRQRPTNILTSKTQPCQAATEVNTYRQADLVKSRVIQIDENRLAGGFLDGVYNTLGTDPDLIWIGGAIAYAMPLTGQWRETTKFKIDLGNQSSGLQRIREQQSARLHTNSPSHLVNTASGHTHIGKTAQVARRIHGSRLNHHQCIARHFIRRKGRLYALPQAETDLTINPRKDTLCLIHAKKRFALSLTDHATGRPKIRSAQPSQRNTQVAEIGIIRGLETGSKVLRPTLRIEGQLGQV
ncbi:hypothetical protein [Aquipseudomonas alcaligenes]|uniref:hypothetical protein n=1 Tax=Aquipseudomonas alcaligenes TaxID=43263 RepID=UPI0009713B24|nr:hypothetical protein [Pseudomonas alcaligenes]